MLINKSIELQVGGEYSFGGLFDPNADQSMKDKIFSCFNWNQLVLPVLQQVMADPRNYDQPILHAAIINKVPQSIIKDMITQFPYSIGKRDSLGRFPITVALQHKFRWEDGLLKEMVETFISNERASTALSVCTKYGLQWDNGMKNVVGEIDDHELYMADKMLGLYPFMVAGVGGGRIRV